MRGTTGVLLGLALLAAAPAGSRVVDVDPAGSGADLRLPPYDASGSPRATPGAGLGVGDLDGDAVPDLAIGEWIGGRVFVVTGPVAAGTDAALIDVATIQVVQPASEDRLGIALAVGDLDGDGRVDLVAGASGGDGPADDRFGCGELHVLFGPLAPGERHLADAPADLLVVGAEIGDGLGDGEIRMGDLSGDGVPDLIVGVPSAETSRGHVVVLFGPLSPGVRDLALQPPDVVVRGADGFDELGAALAAADVDGDGSLDLAIGAPLAEGPGGAPFRAGAVHVLRGPLTPGVRDLEIELADLTVHGDAESATLGRALAVADLNDDCRADLAMGAPVAFNQFTDRPGQVHVLFGPIALDGGVRDLSVAPAEATLTGAATADQAGRSLAVGDVDADGAADLVVASPNEDGVLVGRELAGRVRAVGGPLPAGDLNLATARVTLEVLGERRQGSLGIFLHVDDANGDAVADLLLGATSSVLHGVASTFGCSYVVLGGPEGCLADPAADCDGDGRPNDTDCRALNPSLSGPPGPPDLRASRAGAGARVSWSAAPGAEPTCSTVLATGVVSDLRADGRLGTPFARAACLSPAGPPWQDDRPSVPSDGYYHLVRTANPCGPGVWGSATAGPRALPCP